MYWNAPNAGSQLYGSTTTVVMAIYGLPWKWQSLTPLPETPEWIDWKNIWHDWLRHRPVLNDLAKFGFGRIFGDWGTTSCSMYVGTYVWRTYVVYMSVTVA